MATAPTSEVLPNYHQQWQAALNQQINMELYASYVYLSMACYFDRNDVALKNFTAYFLRHSHNERDRAEMLIMLQNLRGGHLQLSDIRKPDVEDWGSVLNAMEFAFHMEQNMCQSLLELCWLATDSGDAQLSDIVERNFLNPQVKTVKELASHVMNLQNLEASDTCLLEYLFEKFSLGNSNEEK